MQSVFQFGGGTRLPLIYIKSWQLLYFYNAARTKSRMGSIRGVTYVHTGWHKTTSVMLMVISRFYARDGSAKPVSLGYTQAYSRDP
jgi:hypothetical protein